MENTLVGKFVGRHVEITSVWKWTAARFVINSFGSIFVQKKALKDQINSLQKEMEILGASLDRLDYEKPLLEKNHNILSKKNYIENRVLEFNGLRRQSY